MKVFVIVFTIFVATMALLAVGIMIYTEIDFYKQEKKNNKL